MIFQPIILMVQHVKEGYCKLLYSSGQRRTSELTTQALMILNARHMWPPEMPCRVNKLAPLWANDYKKRPPRAAFALVLV